MDNNRFLLEQPEYKFLKTDEHLGDRICLLTISGSRAYGTNNENSDTDIRGVALERPVDIYGNGKFEQVEERETDTVIYALKKYVNLCCGCNPNVIEMLGTREQDVLYINDIGKILRDNARMFLSKRAYVTFAGYATMQLRRLENALAHDSYPEAEKERHIMKSIESMIAKTEKQYRMSGDEVRFSIPEDGEDPTIHISLNVTNMPLRGFLAFNSDLNNMLRNYGKLNHRNNKKDDAHLRKHAMHLIRLYLTGIDVLEKGEIITYREENLPLLRGIRNGDVPLKDVLKMADEHEARIKKAYETSHLPECTDMKKVDELLIDIYKRFL